MASEGRSAREVIRAAMKTSTGPAGLPEKILGQGRNGNGRGNGAALVLPPGQQPKGELDQAIQRYVDLYDFAPIGYVSLDRVGRVEEVNLEAAQLLGRPRHLLVGSLFARYVAKEDAGLFLDHLLRCRSSESRVETELRLKKRDGEIISAYLSSTATTSSMRDGALLFQTAIVNLTGRKVAEEALRQSEKRYRTLFDLVSVAVYACDSRGLIQEFNQRAVELWGRKPKTNDPTEKFCGSFKIFYPDGRVMPHEKCPMARVLRGEKLAAKDLEIVVERTNGVRRNVVANPSASRNERGKIIGAINVLYDITEHKRAEAVLREAKSSLETRVRKRTADLLNSNKKLLKEIARGRALECEILGISDREQRRLGQDLHDSLCQHLAAVAFMAQAVSRRLKDHRVVEVDDLEKIANLINDGVTEARTIARGLHPVDMDSAGLSNALRALLHQHSKLPYRLDMDEELSISDPTVALHLYRIASEAINNANKHAHARELIVRMRSSRKQIELSVTDDGIGIGKNRGDGTGMGFHIMDYRARSIGARLEIGPIKPHGTRVACYVPQK
jgi:PAS domain S-box-containing protein